MAGDPPSTREKILIHLEAMRAAERGMMNVAPSEGEFLAGLVKKVDAKRVLEIGTSNGYSGIWMASALRETGGRLTTLEIDDGRHALAVKNFRAAGVADIVDSRLTDALQELTRIEGPFDMVFIDAWKPDYFKYLQLVLPKVRPGGVIAAHNVTSSPGPMSDFLEAIKTNPSLRTEFATPGPGGFSVSYKK